MTEIGVGITLLPHAVRELTRKELPAQEAAGYDMFRRRPVLRWFEERADVEVRWVAPRYLPDWMRWVVEVPGVREVLTWNVAIVFARPEA